MLCVAHQPLPTSTPFRSIAMTTDVLKFLLPRNHHNRQHNLRFRCLKCDVRFGLRTDLERHKRNVHKDTYKPQPSEVYTCMNTGCATPEKEFYRKDNFQRH